MITQKLLTLVAGFSLSVTSLAFAETEPSLQASAVSSHSTSINEEEWKLVKDFSTECKEDKVYCFQKGLAYGNIRKEKAAECPETLKERFLSAIGQYSQDIEVVVEEMREVNGVNTLYLQVNGKAQDHPLIYDANLYALGDDYVFVSVVCQKDFRSQCDESIGHFLGSITQR